MDDISFRFDKDKAIEAILYLADRVSESNVYGICKLLYLADKLSLEAYGRFIFGETYVAMEQGATPSNAYDLLKEAMESPVKGLSVEGYEVIALREANIDYFSESDIEILDKIIKQFGKASNRIRREKAHDEAWQMAWQNRGDKKSVRIPIERIAKLLTDADDLIAYLSNSHEK